MVVENPRPRLLLFAEKPGWALHTIARHIERFVRPWMDTTIVTLADALPHDADAYDIVHVLFYEDRRYRACYSPRTRLLMSVYSHRWQQRGLSSAELLQSYLCDAVRIAVPSTLLLHTLQDLPMPVHLTPEGVDTTRFRPAAEGRKGPPVAGWAGNPNDPMKQFGLVRSACEGVVELRVADGALTEEEMIRFYQNIDFIVCGSIAEGCPRPLLEGMACGNYPISFPVGIAPEILCHPAAGSMVEERTESALRESIRCAASAIEDIRQGSPQRAEYIRASRDWNCVLPGLADVYRSMLAGSFRTVPSSM